MPNGPLTLQELAELNNNLEDMNKKVEEFDNLQKELELVKAELGMFKKDDTNGGTDKPEQLFQITL